MSHVERITPIVKLNLGLKLCDYSDAYILVKKILPVTNTAAADAVANIND